MSAPSVKWFKVADTVAEIGLNKEGLGSVEANGKHLCLALHGERLYACASKCPHAGGALADGYIDALGNIVCPLHRYKFNLSNGRNVTGEGYFLKTYPIDVRPDGVYIGFEEKKWSLW